MIRNQVRAYLGRFNDLVPDSVSTTVSIGRSLAFPAGECSKPENEDTSFENPPADQCPFEEPVTEVMSPRSVVDFTTASTISDGLNSQEVLGFQFARHWDKRCTDMAQLNEYMNAYFSNIHPLIPILHREAFFALYRTYALNVVADPVHEIAEASGRAGRAVSLICAVGALGAMSLAETPDILSREESDEQNLSDSPHYGKALGFYGICLRLMFYTHNSIETMMTYLLMVIHMLSFLNIRATLQCK